MNFNDPSFTWLYVIPSGLVLIWSMSEWLRRRRVRRFLNPALLGITYGTEKRLARLTFFTLGAAAAAAILAFPRARISEEQHHTPRIAILLDSRLSFPASPARVSEEVADSIRSALGVPSGSEHGLYRSGEPPRMLIPPTLDAQGFLLRLDSILQEWQAEEFGALWAWVREIGERHRAGSGDPVRWIIYTSHPEEVLRALPSERLASSPRILIVRVRNRDRGLESSATKAPTPWIDAGDIVALHRFVREKAPARPRETADLTSVRWLASLGLLALSLEVIPFRAAVRHKTARGSHAP